MQVNSCRQIINLAADSVNFVLEKAVAKIVISGF